MSTTDPTKLARRLSKVKHILLVLSGKGGVGKSSISVQVALSLLNLGHAASISSSASDSNGDGGPEGGQRPPTRIGLLDIDLTGPSIPRMLGLDGASIHQSNDGWVPVYLPIQHLQPSSSAVSGEGGQQLSNQLDDRPDIQQEASTSGSTSSATSGSSTGVNGHANSNGASNEYITSQDELKVMSIGFLLRDSRQAVVWRGPKKSAMIRQFLADVRWGELDWLIIDTPPGTSDEHISLLENLLPALQANPNTTLHSVLVTTPQAVSLSDVSKELSFTRRVGLPVVGLVENMSGYVCPHCGDITNIFGRGGGEEFCRLETEKFEEAERKRLSQSTSQGAAGATVQAVANTAPTTSKLTFLGRVPVDPDFVKVVDGPESGKGLLERYNKTTSSTILKEVCEKLVAAISQTSAQDLPAATQSITLNSA